jgi:hypothetical protein
MEWRLREVNPGLKNILDNFNATQIAVMTKTFNGRDDEEITSNTPNDPMEPYRLAQATLENKGKETLADSGWEYLAGPIEGGPYHEYLYSKNGHALILSTGKRDAVEGGLYVSIQYNF